MGLGYVLLKISLIVFLPKWERPVIGGVFSDNFRDNCIVSLIQCENNMIIKANSLCLIRV